MSDEPQFQIPEQPITEPSFWQKYQRSIWFGLIALALLTAGLVAYLLFFRDTTPAPEFVGDIRLAITAPEKLSSGSEISYALKIENLSNTTLTRQELEMFYPAGFTFVDSTPDPASPGGRQFTFSDLAPGRETNITVVGRLEGALQEIKIFSAKLYYVPENFKSVFIAEGKAETTLLAPDLILTISAPTEAIVGQTVNYEVRIANVATRAFSDLVVRLQYPEKFITEEAAEWRVPIVNVGQTAVKAIAGTLSGEPGRDSAIAAELFLKNAEGILVRSHKSVAFTALKAPPLALAARILPEGQALQVGREYILEIAYRNAGETGLTAVQIRASFESPSLSALKISADKALVKNNIVSYLPATHPELAVVSPGTAGKFNLHFTLQDELVKTLQKNPVVLVRLEFESAEVGQPLGGEPVERRVSSALDLSSTVKKTGDNIYAVNLIVSNTVNDIADAVLVAEIGNAASALSVNENDATYNGVTGILRWQIGGIFPFAGSFHEPRRLTLAITADDPILLKNLKLVGKDQFTGVELTAELPQITAN